MKGGKKKKSMLLAFQRDESTAFPKCPQRQHHREMGEKCETGLFSIYASEQTVEACSLFFFAFVHAHFCARLLTFFPRPIQTTQCLCGWACI